MSSEKNSPGRPMMIMGALGVIVLAGFIILNVLKPIFSTEYESVEFAQTIAADVTSLSALTDVTGRIALTRSGEFQIIVHHRADKKPGYYVEVSRLVNGKQQSSANAHILAYPTKEVEGLSVNVSRTNEICILKGKGLARVVSC